jgi:protein O-mannosyl-transferase
MLAAVLLAYFNHFQNEFHFDDFHTVTGNPSIRSLRNIPKFFTDARTFSTLPSNQSYRPIVSTTLALDYWAGGGLRPFYFHLSTFLWFLLQLVLMFFLFRRIFDQARPDSPNVQYAFFAAAWYGLHPANAETINYVVQRGDLFSTLGMVAALSLWHRAPGFWYLIPLALAQLSKPPALIFPAILFAYLCLMHALDWRVSARRSGPALLVTAVMAILQARMPPPSFVAGAVSAYGYRITQPFVALHYFVSFFLPLWLTADTDMRPFDSILDIRAMLGFVFLAALIATVVLCARRREMRPIAFGLAWFLLALVPTSIFPLAEVENDHRMFFPFVGLAMSVVWASALKMQHRPGGLCYTEFAVALLIVCGFGTWQRNQAWRTEETLWRDVTIKSPANGRGLMNYGLTQMSKGDYQTALACFQRALVFTPAYPLLEVNLGFANEGLGRADDAARHFARAISLAPNDPQVRFYYHRWLETKAHEYLNRSLLYHQAGQYWRCIGAAQEALRLQPDYAEAYNNIAAAYESMGMWEEARDAARKALRIRPDFELARNNLTWVEARQNRNKRGVP